MSDGVSVLLDQNILIDHLSPLLCFEFEITQSTPEARSASCAFVEGIFGEGRQHQTFR